MLLVLSYVCDFHSSNNDKLLIDVALINPFPKTLFVFSHSQRMCVHYISNVCVMAYS